jgi:glycosyltransferase involved in cell wall biosynthesis
MKIVYFIDHLRPDGAQFVLRQLVEGLAARGHAQTVICLNDSWDNDLVKRLTEAGAHVRIVGKVPIIFGYGLLSTFLFLRRERFDVAVTLLFVSDVIGRTLAHFARIPWIVTSIQTRDEFYRGWQRWLVRRTVRWADVVELCSENIRDFAVKEEGVPVERICVIPHSIQVEDYVLPDDSQAVRSEFGLGPTEKLVVSLGRLTYQKGYDILLQAIAMLDSHDVHVLLAGKGEDEAKFRALANSLGIGERVHFAGYRRDVPRLLHGLDIYTQPSRYEGMSLAILQAMASSCPIVATAVDGTRELIVDGIHGWLVPPEDVNALAAAIQNVCSDPCEAKRRGAAAYQRVLDQFTLSKMITAWENILCQRGK